jgi:hypothetical protein
VPSAIPPKVVLQCLRKMNPSAASGMDRWSSALLLAAVQNSDSCLSSLASLLHCMLLHRKVFAPACSWARGIALVKGVDDVRPIGIGGFFVKLLASVCVNMDDPARLLPSWQLGMAKNGCPRVIRDARAAHDGGSYLMTIDAENAHNSISRSACWASLLRRKAELPFLLAFFQLAYATPTSVFYSKSGNDWLHLTTNVGVRQGCPAASFAYNLATADALDPVFEAFKEDHVLRHTRVLAIHDDITLMHPDVHVLRRIFSATVDALASRNLRVQPAKCEILVPPHATELDFAAAKRIDPLLQVVDSRTASIRIVGAHIGCDASAAAFVASKLDEALLMVTNVARLGHDEPRAAVALLRFCCIPKLRYRFATHRPDICHQYAVVFDDKVFDALTNFIGPGIKRDLVYSGYGLNFTRYVPLLPILWRRFVDDTPAPRRSLDDHTHRRDALADPAAELRTALDATLLTQFPLQQARLSSQGHASSASTSWLSPFAPPFSCVMPGDARVMIRHLLMSEERSPSACRCGFVDAGDHAFFAHTMTCCHLSGATWTYRHNRVLHALDTSIRRFGFLTSVEPTFYVYADGSKKRPDLTVFANESIVTDLTISVDMDNALKEKLEKHNAAAMSRGHIFLPIAMGIFGQLHPSVYQFLSRIFRRLPKASKRLAILQTMRSMSEAWLEGSIAMFQGVNRAPNENDFQLDGP